MKSIISSINSILLVSVVLFSSCKKKEKQPLLSENGSPIELNLPKDIREILRAEMFVLQDGILKIRTAIKEKDYMLGKEGASQIENPYVLNESLTAEQREIFNQALPDDFVELDKQIHKLAAKLANSFTKKDFKKAQKLDEQVRRKCLYCHTQYWHAN